MAYPHNMEKTGELEWKVSRLVDRLPPMPETVDRLIRAGGSDREKEDELLRVIENDPGLCSDLLRFANMSPGAAGGGIETVGDAVRSVGMKPLVQFVGVSFAKKAIREEFSSLENLQEYFDHSQGISASCAILAEACGLPRHQREMYGVAGLIHDIGRLVILLAADRTGAHLLGTSWDEMISIVGNENKILGMNHCDVGMQICRKWHFSPVLQEGVMRHHTPLIKRRDFSFPGALIFIAHFVSMSDFTGEILQKLLPPGVLERMNLSPSDFNEAQRTYGRRGDAEDV